MKVRKAGLPFTDTEVPSNSVGSTPPTISRLRGCSGVSRRGQIVTENGHQRIDCNLCAGRETRGVCDHSDRRDETAWPALAKTHAAPMKLLSSSPPRIMVAPSSEIDTLPSNTPMGEDFTVLAPVSLLPDSVHAPPEREYTQAAPTLALSYGPPTIAVFPSPASATEAP